MIPFDAKPQRAVTRGGYTYEVTELQMTINDSPISYLGYIIDENGREFPCRWSLTGQSFTNKEYDLIPQI